MRLVRPMTAAFVVVAAAGFVVRSASAATCGDADGNGAVTVTDGVQALRSAAALSTTCPNRVCDADGQGQVTVTDGVVILRAAATLPVKLDCGTEISGIFGGITKVRGAETPQLELGAPPPPGIQPTLGTLLGTDQVRTGRSVAYSVPYDLDAPGDLIIAARGDDGARIEGFYTLALPAGTGTVEVQLPTERSSEPMADSFVDVEFFTRSAAAVSSVSSAELDLIRFGFEIPPVCRGGTNAGAECGGNGACPGGFCGDLTCLSGTNAGGPCFGDDDCPGGGCPDFIGCADGPNQEQPCTFNSECPGSICRPD